MRNTCPILLLAVLLGGCASWPDPDPPARSFHPLEWAYWTEATDARPAELVGLWRPRTGEAGAWFVFGRTGVFRRLTDGRVPRHEGAYRRKADLLNLHVQRFDGKTAPAPNVWRFRYRLAGDTLRLEVASYTHEETTREDLQAEGSYQLHELVRAARLPPGAGAGLDALE